MGSFSITHWLILLVVVVVIFGTSKLKNAGKDLGGAVKGFKDAVKDENEQHLNKNRVLEHEKAELNTTQTQQDKPVSYTHLTLPTNREV